MGYKACNEVLQKLYADCCSVPADQAVRTPWGVALNGTGRFAAITAIRNNYVGVANNGAGKYKLYHRAATAGNWLFEIWPLWKSSILLAVFVVMFTGVGMLGSGVAQVTALLVLGGIGLLVFGGRAVSFSGSYVAGMVAGSRSYVAGVYPSVMGLAASISCFVAIYAMGQGFEMSKPDGWWTVDRVVIVVIQRFFLVWVGSALASILIEACGFGVYSTEVMAEEVMTATNYNKTLLQAAEESGLRHHYEHEIPAKKGGGNILVVLFFLITLVFIALWPLMYVI